jgi:hypothetical protein
MRRQLDQVSVFATTSSFFQAQGELKKVRDDPLWIVLHPVTATPIGQEKMA